MQVSESSKVCVPVVRSAQQVGLHEVVIAGESVEMISGRADHPDKAVGEATLQKPGSGFQVPLLPRSVVFVFGHILDIVLEMSKI